MTQECNAVVVTAFVRPSSPRDCAVNMTPPGIVPLPAAPCSIETRDDKYVQRLQKAHSFAGIAQPLVCVACALVEAVVHPHLSCR